MGAPKLYDRGVVVVFFGNPVIAIPTTGAAVPRKNMFAAADVKMTGTQPDCNFGQTLSAALDVDKDKYDDLLIGSTCGEFFLVGGKSIADKVPVVKNYGTNVVDKLVTLANAGDIDNNGTMNVLVGLPAFSRVELWEYDAIASGLKLVKIFQPAFVNPENWFGYSLANAGHGDFIVGAPKFGNGIVIMCNAPNGNCAPINVVAPIADKGNFGSSVCSGIGGLKIFGEPNYTADQGLAFYMYKDKPEGGAEFGPKSFGFSCSVTGDLSVVNPANVQDVAIGAPYAENSKGVIRVYSGGVDSKIDIPGLADGDQFGYSVGGRSELK